MRKLLKKTHLCLRCLEPFTVEKRFQKKVRMCSRCRVISVPLVYSVGPKILSADTGMGLEEILEGLENVCR